MCQDLESPCVLKSYVFCQIALNAFMAADRSDNTEVKNVYRIIVESDYPELNVLYLSLDI